MAIAYEDLGYSKVYPALFPNDHTHTSPAGADVVAKAFVNGLKCKNHALAGFLTTAGKAIPKVCRSGIPDTPNYSWSLLTDTADCLRVCVLGLSSTLRNWMMQCYTLVVNLRESIGWNATNN